jgi:hypothetical protein
MDRVLQKKIMYPIESYTVAAQMKAKEEPRTREERHFRSRVVKATWKILVHLFQ